MTWIASLTSGPPAVARPIVGFGCRFATPAVHGVVETHGRFELLEIVAIHARITERSCEQTRCFRRKVKAGRVGTAHDCRQSRQGLGAERKLFDHGIEGARRTTMAPEHTVDVKGRGIKALCNGSNLGGKDK